jgi:hypothetical protein
VSSLVRIVAIVMLLSATSRATEHDWPAPPPAKVAEERVSLSMTSRAGLIEAPFVSTAFPEVSGFAVVLTSTAAVQVSPLGWLHVKLPISFVRLDFPARAQVAETALGNLELGLEHPVEVLPATRLGLLAGFLVPSAEHGSSTALLNNRALALGSALTGGEDTPLLTPGVTGLRLGASVEHSLRALVLRASLDVPVLVRISDASLPDDVETHRLGVLPSLDLSAAFWINSAFAASLGAALITEPWRVQEPALPDDRKQRLQPVLEPGLHLRLGRRLTLALDGSVPVAGALGGDAWSLAAQGRFAL